jgi:hypothetical protein
MHCCWEGVTAQMVNIWMNTKKHKEQWYIGSPQTLAKMNEKWEQIEVPNTFREITSFENKSNWKGKCLIYETHIFYIYLISYLLTFI